MFQGEDLLIYIVFNIQDILGSKQLKFTYTFYLNVIVLYCQPFMSYSKYNDILKFNYFNWYRITVKIMLVKLPDSF